MSDKGQFNLDYEESVLLRSKLGKAVKILKAISKILGEVLTRLTTSGINPNTIEMVRKAKDKAEEYKDLRE